MKQSKFGIGAMLAALMAGSGVIGPLQAAAATKLQQKTARPSRGRAAGAYGRGLNNHFNRKRLSARPNPELRDAHGAFTYTGREVDPLTGITMRRVWLAGESARRGY